MTTVTATKTTTYRIEEGKYGEVLVTFGGLVIARRLKMTVRRSFALAELESFLEWNGNTWDWLGIQVKKLPFGCTTKDIIAAYAVAHDELEESGYQAD